MWLISHHRICDKDVKIKTILAPVFVIGTLLRAGRPEVRSVPYSCPWRHGFGWGEANRWIDSKGNALRERKRKKEKYRHRPCSHPWNVSVESLSWGKEGGIWGTYHPLPISWQRLRQWFKGIWSNCFLFCTRVPFPHVMAHHGADTRQD